MKLTVDEYFYKIYYMAIENLYERGMITLMTLDGLIAVVSLALTAFGLGYTTGSNKAQK